MDDSVPYPAMEVPAWKSISSWGAAIVLAVLFVASGVWKITDPLGWSVRIVQLQVPAALAMPATLSIGSLEVFSGVLILVPRFRRWGAWLMGLLLVAFMVYIGYHYNTLVGEECSCFPWLKRAVGPNFFIGDAAMLGLAFVAGRWTLPSRNLRGAALVLAAIVVFTAASYGVTMVEQSRITAPEWVLVEGEPFRLDEGRVFVYFFDPSCMHCFHAAQQMSGFEWNDVRILAAPTANPEFAQQFLDDTGLRVPMTSETARLRETFEFGDAPYGVLLEEGRQRHAMTSFNGQEPEEALRVLGWIR